MKKALINIIRKLPIIGKLYDEALQYRKNCCYPAGHYYSPVLDLEQLKRREKIIWKDLKDVNIEGVDLNTDKQIELLKECEQWYNEIPFPEEKSENLRYYFNNEYYPYTDAIILYFFIRKYKPARIIEVGSGFSSALMLDTKMLFQKDLHLTCIEPYPERLYALLSDEDKKGTEIIVKLIQEVPVRIFTELKTNDILLIDSSHVTKTDSDLNYLLFEIIPHIKKGVLIHFHDIFYPFEYHKNWVFSGRNWSEDYLIRAFLMYNNSFKILFFAHYLHQVYPELYKNMPLAYKDTGGNFWITKIF